MLTFDNLSKHDPAWRQAANDGETRVVIHAPGGVQIGIPGVGEEAVRNRKKALQAEQRFKDAEDE